MTATTSLRTEREVKLRPGEDVDLLSLLEAGDLGLAASRPTLALVATYYDTSDLTLASEGITVRHRSGEPPDRWTLKLPAGSTGHALVRSELDLEGPDDHVPTEIERVLAVHLRGRPLRPIAVISTTRDRIVVRNDAGKALVEIAHDVVTATREGSDPISWTEIEIEALQLKGGTDTLRRTVRALLDAGCRRAPATPKLVRALGDDADRLAPRLALSALPHHPRPADAIGYALARSVRQILDHDPRVRLGGEAEDLHQLRVALRRLRSDIHLLDDPLGTDETDRLAAELGWVAGQTNVARDLDVLSGWLQETDFGLDDLDAPGLESLVRRCEDQQRECRRAVLDALRSERYLALVDELVSLAATPVRMTQQEQTALRKLLRRQLHRRWHRLQRRMDAVKTDPNDRPVHRARIATKRCRAAAEAAAPVEGHRIDRLAHALAKLQDVLGAAHDASVTQAWLRQAAPPSAVFVAGQLAAAARSDSRHQLERWPEVWAEVRHRGHHL